MLFGAHGFMDTVHGEWWPKDCNDSVTNSTQERITRFTSDLNQFGYFTRPTLAAFGELIPFDTVPLYALIHEPIYARKYRIQLSSFKQKPELIMHCSNAPNWSADRVMKQYPEFMNKSADSPDPIYFTGEMVIKDSFHCFHPFG